MSLQAENHKLLRTLYDAQAKRLAFTLEGQLLTFEQGTQCKCPFCGKITDAEHVSEEALAATRAEFKEAESSIHQFQAAHEELDARIESQRRLVDSLGVQCEEIDGRISATYAPSVAALRKQIDRYLEYTRKQHELNIVSLDLEDLQNDYDTADQKPIDEAVEFKPKEEFPGYFKKDMSTRLEEMLSACLLQELQSVRFEMATMDVSVEWQDKESFGEGYRAFLNSVMAFTLFCYLCDEAKYAPGILILDSPIQAMKEQEGKPITTQLFNYIINHSSCGQVFIIENKLPDGTDTPKATLYTFDEEGFLPDFRHPTKRRKEDTSTEPSNETGLINQ